METEVKPDWVNEIVKNGKMQNRWSFIAAASAAASNSSVMCEPSLNGRHMVSNSYCPYWTEKW
jgi:hypothetical protein